MQARMTNPAYPVPDAGQALQALFQAMRHDMEDGVIARTGLVVAWRETPYFTDAERAALALTEAATRLADRSDPVPDDIWDEAARHYDEAGLAAIILMAAVTNLSNRLNVTTRQLAGQKWG
ncbi:carboxymuconolactone decarboxylase family protein [Streptosporangium sandarakinum]